VTRPCDHTVTVHDRQDEQIVLGVDTHADAHVAAVITVLGALVETRSFPATAAGYTALLDWARGHGWLYRAGVEGTSSHGTALNRHLTANGVAVIEVNRPDRAVRRRRGKTDAIDAENAARAVLNEQATAVAKSGDGVVEMIRLFKIAKDSATKARTQTINQLRAVLARAEPALREALAGLGLVTLIRRCAELSDTGIRDIGGAAAHVLRVLATRIQWRDAEICSHQQHLTTLIEYSAPELLQRFGIGPDTASALLITAGDNPARLNIARALSVDGRMSFERLADHAGVGPVAVRRRLTRLEEAGLIVLRCDTSRHLPGIRSPPSTSARSTSAISRKPKAGSGHCRASGPAPSSRAPTTSSSTRGCGRRRTSTSSNGR
jgi:transposase